MIVNLKRCLSILLAVMLLIGIIPAAYAVESGADSTQPEIVLTLQNPRSRQNHQTSLGETVLAWCSSGAGGDGRCCASAECVPVLSEEENRKEERRPLCQKVREKSFW